MNHYAKRETELPLWRRIAAWMGLLFLLALMVFFFWAPMHAQERSNTYYAAQFAGADVGAKITAAQAQCSPNTAIPCTIVIDAILAGWPQGTPPSRCAQCYWIDYTSASGWKVTPLLFAAANVSGILPPVNGGTGQNSTAVYPVSGNVVTEAATETLTSKRISPRAVVVADATSITPNSDTSDIVTQTNTQVAGTLTLNAPTGTPTDGQRLIIRIKSTNAQTYSFNATYKFSTTVVAPVTLAAGKTDYIGCMWDATNTVWDVVSVDQGH